MAFDPEKVERHQGYLPTQHDHSGDEIWVTSDDYDQLLSLLHDVATEADPAGTLRQLRLAQDTIKSLEIENQELRAALKELWEDIGYTGRHNADPEVGKKVEAFLKRKEEGQ